MKCSACSGEAKGPTGAGATVSAIVDYEIAAPTYMIGTTGTNFRAARGPVEKRDGDRIRITAETAAALQIHVGEPVRIVELCPQ